jgi:DNA-binding transcriptional ArsR family regulator
MTDSRTNAEYCAEKLKALSDPLRLRIVELLQQGELAVGDICEFLDSEMVLVSHHLQILKGADLVESRRDGRYIIYALKPGLLKRNPKNASARLDFGCCQLQVPNPPNPE